MPKPKPQPIGPNPMRPFPGDEAPPRRRAKLDPHERLFETPPIEGMPYERGSEEDKASERIIEEADRRKSQDARRS